MITDYEKRVLDAFHKSDHVGVKLSDKYLTLTLSTAKIVVCIDDLDVYWEGKHQGDY